MKTLRENTKAHKKEKEDLLAAYEEFEGDMDAVYEQIMCSNVLDDDERFRTIIDSAIKDEEIDSYKKYSEETKARRKQRQRKARDEADEAMELAEDLGIKDKLFGKGEG